MRYLFCIIMFVFDYEEANVVSWMDMACGLQTGPLAERRSA